MANYVLVNQAQHQSLRINDQRSAELGDEVMFTMTFPYEFRNIQGCYPIFFQKNAENGNFYPIALFGFQQGENLFLDENGWNASYIPLSIQRQPFLIGFQEDSSAEDGRKAVVTLDLDSPRVNEEEGQALFADHGGVSDYLQAMTARLEMIHAAHEHSEKFTAAITELALIEPFTLDIKLNDGSDNQLLGFYTINEEKLQELDGETMEKLNKQGFLQPMFMVIASHSCLRTLIDAKNNGLSA